MKNIFTLLLLFVAISIFAQDGTVRGIVIDDIGEPAIGANVFVKETSLGAATDLDGQFSLTLPVGTYTLQVSYIGLSTKTIEGVVVKDGEVTALGEVTLQEGGIEMAEIVVSAEAITNNETALLLEKKKSSMMIDGISAAKIKLTGDGTAVEAAKRVTGVSIEGGKYVYVRGLGDRYSKTTLNGVEVPGLDPDRNTLQMDIFPTNLIKNIVVSKNFTAEMPADFTGGLLNIETKDFPEDKFLNVSVSTSYNPDMHLNSNFLTYEGGSTDFLGFDDGTRSLPAGADANRIPSPVSGQSSAEVNEFIRSFNPELEAIRRTSPLDISAGISLGNQIDLKERNGKNPKLGYTFSLSYKSSYRYYNDMFNGEYQRILQDPSAYDLIYATTQEGELSENNVLIGALGGLAYKTDNSKIRFTVMHLQNGESRAAKFDILNSEDAVGQSGYIAHSDNLEYNQRSLTNVLLGGKHVFNDNNWEIDWRISPTLSTSNDPDIRKTAFTEKENGNYLFEAGSGGNPSRIWRYLTELNAVSKIDLTKKQTIFGNGASLKFGASHVYKLRNYEILSYDMQFFGTQTPWTEPVASNVLDPINIFPADQNNIYYSSGNSSPNPNEYTSNINNTAVYISEEFMPITNLKAIIGVRAEYFVQRHTGRDQLYASGNTTAGVNLENEKVLEDLGIFPSLNLIYSVTEDMNIRAGYSRTTARPSFKELSFAQILDPVSSRFFNGGFFTYGDEWDGNLVVTDINNIDLRWEYFMERGELLSISAFYKDFINPIELVRIASQQTTIEFQPRNVGRGTVLGIEVEAVKNLGFISGGLEAFSVSGNLTLVESSIEMVESEFNSRQNYERDGETIENTRQMAGQAPYVVNAGLMYDNKDLGLNAGIFYNVKGPTLTIVGLGLYPDVYNVPFHSLNFGINKKLGKDGRTVIDFKVSNILNDKRESVYRSFNAEDQYFNSFSPGISFGLGVSHKF